MLWLPPASYAYTSNFHTIYYSTNYEAKCFFPLIVLWITIG